MKFGRSDNEMIYFVVLYYNEDFYRKLRFT